MSSEQNLQITNWTINRCIKSNHGRGWSHYTSRPRLRVSRL